jgi:hypothetical protein
MSDLGVNAQPPVGMHMSVPGQTIFTIGVTLPLVVFVILAVRQLRKERDTLPLLCLAGGALCMFMEPVVDVLGQCWFPRTNQWIGLETFGRPIPMFMWPVYTWFIGGQAYLFYRAFTKGLTRTRLMQLWLLVWGVNVVLETPGIWMNVYTYYGKQPFNLWGLPLWWPPVNATMPIVAGFALWKLLPYLRGWRVLGVIALLPMADGLTNGAIGLPVWSALNTRLGFWATYPAAVVTFGLGAFTVWALGTALPVGRAEVEVVTAAPRPIPREAATQYR